MENQIFNENCLTTMARMPDNSIDCVVTSPPYWGLRSYKTEPQIWGGEKDCEHIWGDNIIRKTSNNFNANFNERWGNSSGNRKQEQSSYGKLYQGSFCSLCNAWRGELGSEPDLRMFINNLISIFREIYRVLKPSGSCWVNLGDSYMPHNGTRGNQTNAGSDSLRSKDTEETAPKIVRQMSGIRNKSLCNIPSRFAIAMTDELKFIQRNEIIWFKPACMPASVTDRFTVDFEKIFFFTKNEKYYFEQQREPLKQSSIERVEYGWKSNHESIGSIDTDKMGLRFANPSGRNMRTVWRVNFEPSSENHFASYPTKLIETPILAGAPVGGLVYDPFLGTGTTAVVAHRLGRKYVGSELNPDYFRIADDRLTAEMLQNKLFD